MTYFSQGEVINIVSRLIHEAYARRPDYINRAALVHAFLADEEGQVVAERGWGKIEADNRNRPRAQWRYGSKPDFVGNMIDWFSAHYGRGNEALVEQFSRVREGKHWAYKPLPGVKSLADSAVKHPAILSTTKSLQVEPKLAPTLAATTLNISDPALTFPLERHLQSALRAHISQLAPDLVIIDGGKERWNNAGRSDILARDGQGTLVVIELKAGIADDTAITQLLAYMDAFEEEEGRPVRGVLVAADFSDRTRRAARRIANLQLQRYAYSFRFEEAG